MKKEENNRIELEGHTFPDTLVVKYCEKGGTNTAVWQVLGKGVIK